MHALLIKIFPEIGEPYYASFYVSDTDNPIALNSEVEDWIGKTLKNVDHWNYVEGEDVDNIPEKYCIKCSHRDWRNIEYELKLPDDYNSIYEMLMALTNDQALSADAAEWCQSATSGETYEFGNGEIEIMEFE